MKAIAEFEKVLKLNPTMLEVYANIGNAYMSMGDYRVQTGSDARPDYVKSVAFYEKAVEGSPNNYMILSNLAQSLKCLGELSVAGSAEAASYFKKALELINKSLSINSANWRGYLIKGWILSNCRRLDEAVEAFAAAYKITGDTVPFVKQLLDQAKAAAGR